MNQTKLNTTSQDVIISRYAEAWRNKQAAEAEIEAVKAEMQAILSKTNLEYTYADGATVDFKLVEGFRTAPVGFAEAKALTGFGEANMAKIAGAVDAKKVEAMVKLGKIAADVAEKLLPKASYLQIRATFRK
jgi:molybdopterin-guanine dinucleotide biosynthesis protein